MNNSLVFRDLSEGTLEIPVFEDVMAAVVEEMEQVGNDPKDDEMEWQAANLRKVFNKSMKNLKPI